MGYATSIGKYHLSRTIGEGTFAKVKLAVNTETNKNVAMKIIDKKMVLQNELMDQVKREISTMKLLHHPNIVKIYNVSFEFFMRAALTWTINDFLVYDILSGWSIAGRLVCPYYMERTNAFHLEHGDNNTWFDCHRQFLPFDHVFRRNKDDFRKNKVDRSEPPLRLTEDQVWNKVHGYLKITKTGSCKFHDYGKSHDWIK